MSNMIERVAKAIEGRLDEEFSLRPGFARVIARLAIAAMREPTEEIVAAGGEYMPGAGYAEGAWRSMIDAALERVDA